MHSLSIPRYIQYIHIQLYRVINTTEKYVNVKRKTSFPIFLYIYVDLYKCIMPLGFSGFNNLGSQGEP